MIPLASQGVVMVVMDDLLNDPRVQCEARSAVRAGFQVTVIALQSDRCRIERETVEAGWNRVAGTSADTVEAAARMTLDEVRPERGAPYGDSHAAEVIIQILADYHIAKGSGSSCWG